MSKIKASDAFEAWLEKQGVEELRQAVRKLATDNFKQEISLKQRYWTRSGRWQP